MEIKHHYKPKGIFTVDGFLSGEECDGYIRFSEELGYGDAPITTRMGPMMRKDVRNNDRVMVDDLNMAQKLFERTEPCLPDLGAQPVGLNERFRFYRYGPGMRFRWHYDGYFARDNDEQSVLTMMIYLNDDFSGGATAFETDHEPIYIQPKKGTALFFIHQVLHEGSEVHSGQKYVIRTDVMYRNR